MPTGSQSPGLVTKEEGDWLCLFYRLLSFLEDEFCPCWADVDRTLGNFCGETRCGQPTESRGLETFLTSTWAFVFKPERGY